MIPTAARPFNIPLNAPMARKKLTAEESDEQSDAGSEPALEIAMAELGQIVASLESGQEPLDQSLQRFERGMALLRVCHRQLDEAAKRIEIVTRIGAAGVPETAPFDARATLPKDAQSVTPGRRRTREAGSTASDSDDQLPF
jgi:exodeoxyribonuclease VII small subunit